MQQHLNTIHNQKTPKENESTTTTKLQNNNNKNVYRKHHQIKILLGFHNIIQSFIFVILNKTS